MRHRSNQSILFCVISNSADWVLLWRILYSAVIFRIVWSHPYLFVRVYHKLSLIKSHIKCDNFFYIYVYAAMQVVWIYPKDCVQIPHSSAPRYPGLFCNCLYTSTDNYRCCCADILYSEKAAQRHWQLSVGVKQNRDPGIVQIPTLPGRMENHPVSWAGWNGW